MDVQIRPLEEADIRTKCHVELEAFKTHPRIPMQWPRGYTPDLYVFKESGNHDSLRDPNCRMFKAVDSIAGEILATAEWTFALDPKVEAERELTRVDAPPPSNWPEGGNWELRRYYKINFEKLKRETLNGRPFIVLDFLVVRPEAQGKGAGRRLLAWGIEQADRDGVAMCLESTPAGLALYERHGFKVVRTIAADMREFGWTRPYDQEAAKRYFMIREPR